MQRSESNTQIASAIPTDRTPRLLPALLACLFAGCAAGPDYRAPTAAEIDMPAGWHAKLPHDGKLPELARWWTQFDDPLLSGLILSAQVSSPTLAQAEARLKEARALLENSEAAYLPSLTGTASVTRSNGDGGLAVPGAAIPQTLSSTSAAATLGIDLFGYTQRSVEGSMARLGAAEAGWHDARVALAAEVAGAYTALRNCEMQLEQSRMDLASRTETHRLTTDKVRAGFSAPADALRTEASAADGRSSVQLWQGTCARNMNQLVALTGIPHALLDTRLASGRGVIPHPRSVTIAAIPVETISQRPDIIAAERTLAAASADIGVAIADRLPRLSLTGSIGNSRLSLSGSSRTADPWSFGPALSLPLFDGGSGAARVSAARARHEQALAAYRQKVRQAVQEVEDALVRVATVEKRIPDAELSDTRNQRYFNAREAQYRSGAANLLELEDARRLTIASKLALTAVRLELAQAWIALYRAVGGGWQHAEDSTIAAVPQARP